MIIEATYVTGEVKRFEFEIDILIIDLCKLLAKFGSVKKLEFI